MIAPRAAVAHNASMYRLALTLAAVCLATISGLRAPSAVASDLGRVALERAVPNAEFRGFFLGRRGYESHVWRFRGDGNVQAVLLRYRVDKANTGVEHQDLGRWWLDGNRVCIHWNELMLAKVSCYSVRATNGSHVNFLGPEHIEGTLTNRH